MKKIFLLFAFTALFLNAEANNEVRDINKVSFDIQPKLRIAMIVNKDIFIMKLGVSLNLDLGWRLILVKQYDVSLVSKIIRDKELEIIYQKQATRGIKVLV